MYAVYAVRSLSSGRVYIGQTNDVSRRLEEHNSGRVRSTKRRGPWELVAVHYVPNRRAARLLEKGLKDSHEKRKKWIEQHRLEASMNCSCSRPSRSESEVSEQAAK